MSKQTQPDLTFEIPDASGRREGVTLELRDSGLKLALPIRTPTAAAAMTAAERARQGAWQAQQHATTFPDDPTAKIAADEAAAAVPAAEAAVRDAEAAGSRAGAAALALSHAMRHAVFEELGDDFQAPLRDLPELLRYRAVRREHEEATARREEAEARVSELTKQREELLRSTPAGFTARLREVGADLEEAETARRQAAADVSLLAPVLAASLAEVRNAFGPKREALTAQLRERRRADLRAALSWFTEGEGRERLLTIIRAKMALDATLLTPGIVGIGERLIESIDVALEPAEAAL